MTINNKLKDMLLRVFTVGDPPQELFAGHLLDYEDDYHEAER